MNKLQKYAGWITTMIMICVWLVTIMWYGRKIDSNTEAINKMNEFWEEQLEFRGKVLMYMEMDNHE